MWSIFRFVLLVKLDKMDKMFVNCLRIFKVGENLDWFLSPDIFLTKIRNIVVTNLALDRWKKLLTSFNDICIYFVLSSDTKYSRIQFRTKSIVFVKIITESPRHRFQTKWKLRSYAILILLLRLDFFFYTLELQIDRS